MKLFLWIVTVTTLAQAQYIFGKGVYLGLDGDYGRVRLSDIETIDGSENSTTYSGDARSYGLDIQYQFNTNSIVSVEYRKSNFQVRHNSQNLLNSEDVIAYQRLKMDIIRLRAQYMHLFDDSPIWVGGGVESIYSIDDSQLLHELIQNKISGLFYVGLRTGGSNAMVMPYVGYQLPFSDLRNSESFEVSMAEIRIGLKIRFRVF